MEVDIPENWLKVRSNGMKEDIYVIVWIKAKLLKWTIVRLSEGLKIILYELKVKELIWIVFRAYGIYK